MKFFMLRRLTPCVGGGIVRGVNRSIAYFVALLIAFLPSVALACNATAVLAAAMHGPMESVAMQHGDHEHDCCQEQAHDMQDEDSSSMNGAACAMDAMCAFASAIPVGTNAAVLRASAPAAVYIVLPDRFCSAETLPDLRPPIA